MQISSDIFSSLSIALHHRYHLGGSMGVVVRRMASTTTTAIVVGTRARSCSFSVLVATFWIRVAYKAATATSAARARWRAWWRWWWRRAATAAATASTRAAPHCLVVVVLIRSLTFLFIFHFFVIYSPTSFLWFFNKFVLVLWSLIPHNEVVSSIHLYGLVVEVGIVLS